MTIARRLIILLATPLVVLVGLGLFAINQLNKINATNRFVESRIESLATVGNISRLIYEMRVSIRN